MYLEICSATEIFVETIDLQGEVYLNGADTVEPYDAFVHVEPMSGNTTMTLRVYIGHLCLGLRWVNNCLLYTSPSPRDATLSRMPSSA